MRSRVVAVPRTSVPTIWLLSRRVSELLTELPTLVLELLVLLPRFTWGEVVLRCTLELLVLLPRLTWGEVVLRCTLELLVLLPRFTCDEVVLRCTLELLVLLPRFT